MRRTKEYLGELLCKTSGAITVGMPCSIELTYKVGKYGVEDGGMVQFTRVGVTNWEPIQMERPLDYGFTTVSTTGDVTLDIEPGFDGLRPFDDSITVHVTNGSLKDGEVIKLTMGDTSKGSPGIRAQTFYERTHEFRVHLDTYGSNRFEEIPNSCIVEVLPGAASELNVVFPSIIELEKEFEFTVRVLDDYGNPSFGFDKVVRLDMIEGLSLPQIIDFSDSHKGYKKIKGMAHSPGEYRVTASCEDYEFKATSNVFIVNEKCAYKLYWGDMHGQNEVSAGVGSMEDFMEFAMGPAAIDFTSWQGIDFEINEEKWDIVKEATKKYHKPHKFVPYLGYEWAGISPAGGDHNIYFLNDDEKIYRSSQWLVNNVGREDDGSDRFPISELWDEFKGRKDVMAVPHVGGRHGNFDYYNPELIKLIEIHSNHGIFEWFIREAMDRGMKVGFVATSDDHYSRQGLSYPVVLNYDVAGVSFEVKAGFTAVYSEELTRESIWEALQERRCYATTCSRILMNVKIDDHYMGAEIELNKIPQIDVSVKGNAPIDYVEIYRKNDIILRRDKFKPDENGSNKRVKIFWSGVRTKYRRKTVKWDGRLFVQNGQILSADEYSFDRKDQGITEMSKQHVAWNSCTAGDVDGLILELETNDDTVLKFVSEQANFEIDMNDISYEPKEVFVGELDRKVTYHFEKECPLIAEQEFECFNEEFSFVDQEVLSGLNPYYVKVVQKDGNMAWSSPIYVNYTK